MEGNPNFFIINRFTNPQQVLIKGSTMTFQNGNTYNLNDPDFSFFITNVQIDKEIQNENLIYNFLKDMKYDLNYGDKKLKRYYFIKHLIIQNTYQQSQLGSGLNQYTRASSPSKSSICTGQRPVNPVVCIFLPSDPDELVDQLKLIVLEKKEEMIIQC